VTERITRVLDRLPTEDPYAWLQEATRLHRRSHDCAAYTFTDGRLLLALAREVRPSRVLELGTALGYSACCWADAGALVDTIDRDPSHVTEARKNVARARPSGIVTSHLGGFDAVLPALAGPYDAVFFDGYAPTASMLSSLVARTARPGLLVIANLGLAGTDVGRALGDIPDAEVITVTPDTTAVVLR
jgi:predicted O-methyltransferase YrrM